MNTIKYKEDSISFYRKGVYVKATGQYATAIAIATVATILMIGIAALNRQP